MVEEGEEREKVEEREGEGSREGEKKWVEGRMGGWGEVEGRRGRGEGMGRA